MSRPTAATRAGRLFVILMGPSLGGLVPLALAIAQPAMATHLGDAGNGSLLTRLTISLPSLMIMVGAPLGGFFAERYGYRRSLLILLLVYGFAGSVGLLVPDRIDVANTAGLSIFSGLLASRLVLGLAAGSIMAIYLALAAEYYEGAARARVLGFATAASSLAGVLALMVGGRLVDWQGWRAPFGFYLIAFVVFVVAWFALDPTRRERAPGKRTTDGPGTLRLIATMWPVYVVLLALSIGTFVPSNGGPFLLQANGIMSAATQGAILSAASIPAIATASAYGFLRRFLDDRMILVLTAVLMGVGLIIAVPLHDRTALVVAFAFIGFGTGFKVPAVASVLLTEAPEEVRGAAAGLSFSGIFLGQFLAPLLLEFLGRGIAIQGAFIVIGGSLLVVAVFVLTAGIGKERRKHRKAPLQPDLASDPV